MRLMFGLALFETCIEVGISYSLIWDQMAGTCILTLDADIVDAHKSLTNENVHFTNHPDLFADLGND